MNNKQNNQIYYGNGFSLLFMKSISVEMHSHFPVEIYIGLKNDLNINFGNGWNRCKAVLIDSNLPHQVSADNGLTAVLLIDPVFFKIYKVKEFNYNRKYCFLKNNKYIFLLINKMTQLIIFDKHSLSNIKRSAA